MQATDMITKIAGANVTNISSVASDVNAAKLVRVYANAITIITQTNSTGSPIGNITVPANTVTFIAKDSTDKLASDVAVICTPVAYQVG